MGYIDLHAHTTASDGSLSPFALVHAAVERGVRVLAVTDHDTLAGLQEALGVVEKEGLPLRVVSGIELSALYGDHNVHLLGYGLDPTSTTLMAQLGLLTAHREERARAMLDKLAAVGAPIPWERVRELGGDNVARPHIARVLVEQGHARSMNDAFNRFIGDGAPAYLPSSRFTPAEAIRLVRDEGGEVALAHPGLLHPTFTLDMVLDDLQHAGLTGLEVYHSTHSAALSARLRATAAKRGLWWSGGSDFHDPTKPEALLGAVDVPDAVLTQGPFKTL